MRFLQDRSGMELTEVALVLALVVVAAIVVLRELGVNITAVLGRVSAALSGG